MHYDKIDAVAKTLSTSLDNTQKNSSNTENLVQQSL